VRDHKITIIIYLVGAYGCCLVLVKAS